mmetsp:Transcript_15486/g.23789  ORF Transcript_15486/g.23789 Transcript_15486/m.23789 type:complete len:100 (-) Transcript_15486:668-967(-)
MKQIDHIISEREVLNFLTSRGKSPFIVEFFSSFQTADHLYFEMEYVAGTTLMRQIQERNPIIMENMPFYASEVLLALEHLHTSHIIYRDLKPENILLSR